MPQWTQCQALCHTVDDIKIPPPPSPPSPPLPPPSPPPPPPPPPPSPPQEKKQLVAISKSVTPYSGHYEADLC